MHGNLLKKKAIPCIFLHQFAQACTASPANDLQVKWQRQNYENRQCFKYPA